MGMQGSLSTMTFADLLRWASHGRKGGLLEVEHGRTVKRVELRDGEIVSCSSDDPSSLLGQYLLSRGKIREDTLRSALRGQELTGASLGQVFVEMGVMQKPEVDRFVAEKAEESLLGLFDLHDGVFRFEETTAGDPTMMRVELKTADLLARGERLREELGRIRSVLKTGTVLCRSNRPPVAETLDTLERRIYDVVDGRRTIAEVLLHARTSEFLTMKVLHHLYRRGALRILDQHDVTSIGPNPESATRLARQLVARGDYEAALDALESAHRAHREDETLRRMISKVEAVFVEACYRGEVPPTKVPALLGARERLLHEDLSPAEFFLISTIENGTLDVKSITWIAPMREVEVLRMIKRLLDRGVIELREPSRADSPGAAATASEASY